MQQKNDMVLEWQDVLNSSVVRPYIFRTRFERALLRTITYAKVNSLINIEKQCKMMETKLSFISDHSNQTSDGTLQSFKALEDDMNKLMTIIKEYKMQ